MLISLTLPLNECRTTISKALSTAHSTSLRHSALLTPHQRGTQHCSLHINEALSTAHSTSTRHSALLTPHQRGTQHCSLHINEALSTAHSTSTRHSALLTPHQRGTQHCSLHSLPHTRQLISAMFSSNNSSEINSHSNMPYRLQIRHFSCTPQPLHT